MSRSCEGGQVMSIRPLILNNFGCLQYWSGLDLEKFSFFFWYVFVFDLEGIMANFDQYVLGEDRLVLVSE